jgi:hypothetical protein
MFNSISQTIRAAAILTDSYVAATVLERVENYNEFTAYCYYTEGSLTSLEIKIETSLDGTNYVQETNLSISGGTGTLSKGEYTTTETGNFKISIPVSARFIKVSAKGTGTVTSSSLQIDAFLHTA